MSRARVWLFVEGYTDRAVYGLVASEIREFDLTGVEIVLSRETPFGAGKGGLLDLYRYLRKGSSLTMELHSKRTVCVFLLDKDLDDTLGRRVRSPHVVYTRYYSVENYLVRDADVAKALAAASGLDLKAVAKRFPQGLAEWRKEAARSWREWVYYCVFARRTGANVPSYGCSSSMVHPGPFKPVSQAKMRLMKRKARQALGLGRTEFDRRFSLVVGLVDRKYRAGGHDLVFPGRYYYPFLVHEAEIAAAGRSFSLNAVGQRLEAALVSTLSAKDDWALRFRTAMVWAAEQAA